MGIVSLADGITLVSSRVLADLMAERAAQDAKWGEQNHPDGTGPALVPGADARRDASRAQCQRAARRGTVTWRHILTEEFDEALAEDDPAALRRELVQVAAVAVQWIEAIDRRTAS